MSNTPENIWKKLQSVDMVAVTPEVFRAREWPEGVPLRGLFIGTAELPPPSNMPDLGAWEAAVILHEGATSIFIVPITTALSVLRVMPSDSYVELNFRKEKPSRKGTFRPVSVRRGRNLDPADIAAIRAEFGLASDIKPYALLNMSAEESAKMLEAAADIDAEHAALNADIADGTIKPDEAAASVSRGNGVRRNRRG